MCELLPSLVVCTVPLIRTSLLWSLVLWRGRKISALCNYCLCLNWMLFVDVRSCFIISSASELICTYTLLTTPLFSLTLQMCPQRNKLVQILGFFLGLKFSKWNLSIVLSSLCYIQSLDLIKMENYNRCCFCSFRKDESWRFWLP